MSSLQKNYYQDIAKVEANLKTVEVGSGFRQYLWTVLDIVFLSSVFLKLFNWINCLFILLATNKTDGMQIAGKSMW